MFLLEYVPLTEMAVNPGGRPEGNTVSPDRHIADTLEHLHTGGQLPFTGRETVPTKARRTKLNHLHPGNMSMTLGLESFSVTRQDWWLLLHLQVFKTTRFLVIGVSVGKLTYPGDL